MHYHKEQTMQISLSSCTSQDIVNGKRRDLFKCKENLFEEIELDG